MNKSKELVKNTGIFALANFSSKILIFMLVPIYTRTLSISDYGFYDLVYSTIQLLLPILTLNISESVMRFLLQKNAKPDIILTIGMRSTIIGSIVLAFLLLSSNFFSFLGTWDNYNIYIWSLFFAYAVNNLMVQFAKGIDKIFDMAFASVIGTISMLLLNVIFLVFFDFGLPGFFIANISCFSLPSLYLFLKLKLWGYFTSNTTSSLQKEMYLYSIPLILNTLGWWVNNTSDRYIVTAVFGIGTNGLISVAYKIPQILTTFSVIFIQAWQISAIKENEEGSDNSFASKLFLDYSGLLIILSSVLIVIVKPLSKLLFGNEFYDAWKFVPFLIISSLFNASAGYVGAILAAKMKTNAMAKSATYGMIVNIILNIILALLIGPQGITISTMISSYIIFEIRKRNVPNVLIKKDDYRIQFSWFILILQSLVMIYIDSWFLGIIILSMLILLFGERILHVLNTLNKLVVNRKK